MKRTPMSEQEKQIFLEGWTGGVDLSLDIKECIYYIDRWLDYFELGNADVSKQFFINKISKEHTQDYEFMWGRRKYRIIDLPVGTEIITKTHTGHDVEITDIDEFLELDHYKKAANEELKKYWDQIKSVMKVNGDEQTAPKLKMYWSYTEKYADGGFKIKL